MLALIEAKYLDKREGREQNVSSGGKKAGCVAKASASGECRVRAGQVLNAGAFRGLHLVARASAEAPARITL